MIEEKSGSAPNYGALIEEVFIKPIRTVVVVDDEFPTLEALLAKEMDRGEATWGKGIMQKVQDIIGFCRAPERRWMLEVFGAQRSTAVTGEDEAASNLHQSDLMVLDYHLDPRHQDDGNDAIAILRRLAVNDHFNMVVVYTKGYEGAEGDIPRVAREIAIGLSNTDERLTLQEKSAKIAEKKLEEWEDDQPDVIEKIKNEIDDGIYLMARTLPPGDIEWKNVCLWSELQGLAALLDEAPDPVKPELGLRLLAKWALHQRQQALVSKLSTEDYGTVGFFLDPDSGVNWIRTDKLFITVVSKAHEPSSLPKMLLTALQRWNPEPHRLLMSKMRAVLDERGVLAEAEVLDNQCLQAGWLEEFLTDDPEQRRWKIQGTINRHWEGLGDAIRIKVMDFAERLADQLVATGRDNVFDAWYPALAPADVKSHINRYACSKPVEGSHLTTGHVLHIDSGGRGGPYWLCLSPACDLVPGQKNSGWGKRLGDHIPFIAVEIFTTKREEALANAYGNNQLFLEIDGEVRCFSFTPLPPKTSGGRKRSSTPNPKWEQMFVAGKGKIDPQNKMLTIVRASATDNRLLFDTFDARIVAQLRYEYALNLLQRLGTNLSRVGLDFVEFNDSYTDGQTDT